MGRLLWQRWPNTILPHSPGHFTSSTNTDDSGTQRRKSNCRPVWRRGFFCLRAPATATGFCCGRAVHEKLDEDDGTDACTAMEDLADAQAVADRLGLKLHVASLAAEYWDRVLEHFLEG